MFARYHKYGTELNSHDILKTIAILAMVVDHLGVYIFVETDILRLIGRFAAPLFLFMVGYSLNYNIKHNIIIHALLLVVVSAVLYSPIFTMNILVTIICTRLLFNWMEKREWLEKYTLAVWGNFLVWGTMSALIINYGTIGMMFSLCGYIIAKQKKDLTSYVIMLATVMFYTWWQSYSFGFSAYEITFLTTGLGAMMMYFSSYKLTTYKNSDGLWATPIKFISRYSLEFYTIHLIVLQIIDALSHPEKYHQFKWF